MDGRAHTGCASGILVMEILLGERTGNAPGLGQTHEASGLGGCL